MPLQELRMSSIYVPVPENLFLEEDESLTEDELRQENARLNTENQNLTGLAEHYLQQYNDIRREFREYKNTFTENRFTRSNEKCVMITIIATTLITVGYWWGSSFNGCN